MLIADKEKLILFKTRKVDINNFIFNYQGYYIKTINNNNGNEINIYSKVTLLLVLSK